MQHQCADMYLETESARSAVYYAAWALEENAADASAAVSIAKMYASDAAARSAIAAFRSTAAWASRGRTICTSITAAPNRRETAFGDATFHRERLARLVVDAGAHTAPGS